TIYKKQSRKTGKRKNTYRRFTQNITVFHPDCIAEFSDLWLRLPKKNYGSRDTIVSGKIKLPSCTTEKNYLGNGFYLGSLHYQTTGRKNPYGK
ncbi:hypothetical protein, partial [Chryseobacterium sp. VD8]|uniref:hypothetical protein n=1 Tax=Chryseobacterium sp. VD8 TaxID=3081254 RepID=UPI003018C786